MMSVAVSVWLVEDEVTERVNGPLVVMGERLTCQLPADEAVVVWVWPAIVTVMVSFGVERPQIGQVVLRCRSMWSEMMEGSWSF